MTFKSIDYETWYDYKSDTEPPFRFLAQNLFNHFVDDNKDLFLFQNIQH